MALGLTGHFRGLAILLAADARLARFLAEVGGTR